MDLRSHFIHALWLAATLLAVAFVVREVMR
jgi:hypothetical protein